MITAKDILDAQDEVKRLEAASMENWRNLKQAEKDVEKYQDEYRDIEYEYDEALIKLRELETQVREQNETND